MKKLTPLLGVAGVAMASFSAHAQVFQYTPGDLILDFSESGHSDLEVDIGNSSQFTSGQSYAAVGGYSVANQLLATFGSVSNVDEFTEWQWVTVSGKPARYPF